MNRFQEYIIKKSAKKNAREVASGSKQEKQILIDESAALLDLLQAERSDLQDKYFNVPVLENRELSGDTVSKIKLALGGISGAGVFASKLAMGDGDMTINALSSIIAGTSVMISSEMAMMLYEANYVNKALAKIKKSDIKRNLARIDRDIEKEQLYKQTVCEELELI